LPPDREAAFAAALRASGGAAPAGLPPRRFAVYRGNVAASAAGTLAASFPAVRALVGGEFFDAMALAFAEAHPPRGPVLAEWGDALPAFIAAFPPAASVPYLADVARLERARLAAYHAADLPPLGLPALAALPPDRLPALRVRPHPAAALVASPWPVVALWAESTGRPPPAPVDLARAETALVTRPAFEVRTQALAPGTAVLAAALLRGESLGAATEAALAVPGFEAAAALGTLFAAGAFAGPAPA
jgi:hypothetical protein